MISLLGYELVEQIDEDRATVVYRGHQSESREPVIVKLLKEDFPALADIARLKREYALVRDLPGSAFLRPAALETQGRALVFEDPGYRSLGEVIATGPCDLALFLRAASRLAEGLAQVHLQGYIHRNIRPEVIFLHPATGDVKLAGFGYARRQDEGEIAPFEGNLAYVSPEQTGRMSLPVDIRSDLYSLGVTLYEWLAGRLPFAATDPLELVHAHIARLPPSPLEFVPDLPGQLAAIVLKLLAKTAEARYQDAHALPRRSGRLPDSLADGPSDPRISTGPV